MKIEIPDSYLEELGVDTSKTKNLENDPYFHQDLLMDIFKRSSNADLLMGIFDNYGVLKE